MENQIIIDKLIKSNRKTISLEITAEGKLIVRIPKKIQKEYIDNLISKKSNWIKEKQDIAKKKFRNLKEKQFKNGEKFLYLGRYYLLKIVKNGPQKLEFNDAFYLPYSKREKARKLFIAWYKKRAREYIIKKANIISSRLQIKFGKIRITSAKKRWGSCSGNGNLNFPWRLIMAPQKVIEYVIVHELVHVIDKSHSKSYWQKVKEAFPEYKTCRKWLKDNGYLLRI